MIVSGEAVCLNMLFCWQKQTIFDQHAVVVDPVPVRATAVFAVSSSSGPTAFLLSKIDVMHM